MNFIPQNETHVVDTVTGETITNEEHVLLIIGEQVKNAGHALELLKSERAAMQAEADALVQAQFPHLSLLGETVAQQQALYEALLARLRVEALIVNDITGMKSVLGGAMRIAVTQTVTHYDEKQALDWCEKVHPGLVKRQADKTALTKLAKSGAEMPAAVMVVESVRQTYYTAGKHEETV